MDKNSSYEVDSVSEDLESMTVTIYWDFNNLKNDEKVYLNIGKSNNSENTTWEKIQVEPIGDLLKQQKF